MITNRSMPPAVVIPELSYPDVREATDWLCRTFGFMERLRIGNHRAQLSFGEGSLVVIQGSNGADLSCSVMVRVEEIDSHYDHVKQTGVRILSPPPDYAYGERQYTVYNSSGHHRAFSLTIGEVCPKTWGGILFEA